MYLSKFRLIVGSYDGLWQVPIEIYQNQITGHKCSLFDEPDCWYDLLTENQTYDYFMANFERHFSEGRTSPFPMAGHLLNLLNGVNKTRREGKRTFLSFCKMCSKCLYNSSLPIRPLPLCQEVSLQRCLRSHNRYLLRIKDLFQSLISRQKQSHPYKTGLFSKTLGLSLWYLEVPANLVFLFFCCHY